MDNNADLGDLARLVYLVEGGDSGWRTDHQTLTSFHRQIGLDTPPPNRWTTGPHVGTREPRATGLAPPAHRPLQQRPLRTRLPTRHRFGRKIRPPLLSLRLQGRPLRRSGVHTFTVQPNGPSYEVTNREKFIWGLGATDIDFGFQGTTYLTDFVTGWTLRSNEAGSSLSIPTSLIPRLPK